MTNHPAHRTQQFVGRQREVAEVRRLLGASRILTLTGAGGIGKTRLALRVAADLRGEGARHVALVELAGLTVPELLPQAVASALGAPEHPGRSPLEVVVEAVQPYPLLLVLDTCEHVIDASAELADCLLRTCGELQVLATSREPLRVRGETVWRVPSLSLPPRQGHQGPEQVASSEAVRLFVERAQASLPEFAFDARNAAAIAQLCRRLDGIPLALELAATRVAMLSVEQIVERLDSAQLRSKTPSHTQRWKVRCTELSSGYALGSQFHWQPVPFAGDRLGIDPVDGSEEQHDVQGAQERRVHS